MDRALLKHWLEQGLSLPEIGALTDRDPSTVGYWAKKHGLTANGRGKHSARGGLSKAELQPLVEAGLTLREIAKVFDRSLVTVRYWIDRHGLPRCREVRRSEIEAAVRSGNRTVMRRCRSHGVAEFALVGSANRPRCKRCRSEAVARRRRKVKQTPVDEAGGKCVLCGYDRSVNALEFHHVDPSQKAFRSRAARDHTIHRPGPGGGREVRPPVRELSRRG